MPAFQNLKSTPAPNEKAMAKPRRTMIGLVTQSEGNPRESMMNDPVYSMHAGFEPTPDTGQSYSCPAGFEVCPMNSFAASAPLA